jgi:hypothetical protein
MIDISLISTGLPCRADSYLSMIGDSKVSCITDITLEGSVSKYAATPSQVGRNYTNYNCRQPLHAYVSLIKVGS